MSYDVAVPFCVRPQPAAVAFGRLARNLKELKQLKSVWGDGVSTTREGQMAIVVCPGDGLPIGHRTGSCATGRMRIWQLALDRNTA